MEMSWEYDEAGKGRLNAHRLSPIKSLQWRHWLLYRDLPRPADNDDLDARSSP
jgi:hypothetical protein